LKEVVVSAKKTLKWHSSKEGEAFKEDSFKDWMFSLALRPIYWKISSDAYTNFKMKYEEEMNTNIWSAPTPNSRLVRQR
jgi:hypothetical protein